MKQINDFVKRFGTSISLKENLLVEKKNRYFLLDTRLKEIVSKDFYYAGVYLGKLKKGVFFPGFNLLALIGDNKDANKITLDERTEWLFIVGRDVFKRGIVEVTGSKKRGDYTIVLNQHGECLGFGKVLHNIHEEMNKREVVVKNISDIGDFLRREKQH
jgi:ribosome biogenesis protein Nip4